MSDPIEPLRYLASRSGKEIPAGVPQIIKPGEDFKVQMSLPDSYTVASMIGLLLNAVREPPLDHPIAGVRLIPGGRDCALDVTYQGKTYLVTVVREKLQQSLLSKKQDYEIHVELLPDSKSVTPFTIEEVRRLVAPVCEALSFTLPTLYQDAARTLMVKMICTSHRTTLREAEAACTTFSEACRTAGVRVAREKIEHVIHDVRFS